MALRPPSMTTPRSVTASHHGIFAVPNNKLGSTMLTAKFKIKITCDLRGLKNNPFLANHQKVAAKFTLSTKIISSKSFLFLDK
jgi:hypothetical protein